MPFAKNQGARIFFEDIGTGTPVVLGHSFLCSGKMWREQVPALAEKYRVLNLDFRGHGKSGEVKNDFSLYDAVNDVLAVLDHLEIEKAVWCGLSIGGMVAMRAALVCPQRVSGLVLLDTDAGAEIAARKLKYHAMGMGTRLLGIGPFIGPVSRLMFGASTRRLKPSLIDEWKDEFSSVHVPSVLRGLNALMQRDSLLDRLREIHLPALVIVGEEDVSLPTPLARRIHDLLPDSEIVQIPGAGHLSALEQPAAVTEAILNFVGTIAARGSAA